MLKGLSQNERTTRATQLSRAEKRPKAHLLKLGVRGLAHGMLSGKDKSTDGLSQKAPPSALTGVLKKGGSAKLALTRVGRRKQRTLHGYLFG